MWYYVSTNNIWSVFTEKKTSIRKEKIINLNYIYWS